MSVILVVADESDVEMLFRQQFRGELRAGLFRMDFALSAVSALQRMSDVTAASLILILSDINMPGMTGLELLPKAKAIRPDVPVIMITALKRLFSLQPDWVSTDLRQLRAGYEIHYLSPKPQPES